MSASNIHWWQQLHEKRDQYFNFEHNLTSMIKKHYNDIFFIVASPNYLKVIESELESLTLNGYLNPENTFILSSKIEISKHLMPMHYLAKEDYCSQLKGSRISLNIRLARYLLLGIDEGLNIRNQIYSKYDKLDRLSKPAFKADRKKISDSDLEAYVLNKLLEASNKHASATSLLRDLRGQGLACEQNRFGSIFKKTRLLLNKESLH